MHYKSITIEFAIIWL